MVSDVIHYETKKLVYYKGNISSFVKIHPEAKYYFELQFSPLAFVFPTPERLDGINSTTKTVLKMDHVSYTYPVREGASSGSKSKRPYFTCYSLDLLTNCIFHCYY